MRRLCEVAARRRGEARAVNRRSQLSAAAACLGVARRWRRRVPGGVAAARFSPANVCHWFGCARAFTGRQWWALGRAASALVPVQYAARYDGWLRAIGGRVAQGCQHGVSGSRAAGVARSAKWKWRPQNGAWKGLAGFRRASRVAIAPRSRLLRAVNAGRHGGKRCRRHNDTS
jgi:hypothetical protein